MHGMPLMNSPPSNSSSQQSDTQTPSPRKRRAALAYNHPSYLYDRGYTSSSPDDGSELGTPESFHGRQPLVATNSSPALQPGIEQHMEGIEEERPDMKRRRTAPAMLPTLASVSEPALTVSPPSNKKAMPPYFARSSPSTDGIWPEDVDSAFHEALRFVPKLGRRKVLVAGKPCGRNELIAEYIRRTTGKIRSRKQVSSHIQVLKNVRKSDAEFMALVAEPSHLDDFSPAAASFFGAVMLGPPATPATKPPGSAAALLASSPIGLSAPMMASTLSEGHLSPHSSTSGNNFALFRRSSSTSSCGSPLSQASDISRCGSPLITSSPLLASSPIEAPMGITNGLKDLQFGAMPVVNVSPPAALPTCGPVVPDSLCLWADSDGAVDRMHVFAKLEKQRGVPVLPNVLLKDIRDGQSRFPKLEAMHERMPCQFMHLKVNVAVPRAEDFDDTLNVMHTQLNLKSTQRLRLTAVTTIYSFGAELLSVQEGLAAPKNIVAPQYVQDGEVFDTHQFMYAAPFAADFWQIFLRGAAAGENSDSGPSYGKTPEDRQAIQASINGLSIVQEYVVRSDEPMLVPVEELSRGSSIGDVVLVVAYDFEAVEADKPTSTLSLLSLKKQEAPITSLLASVQAGFTVPPRVPSPLSHPQMVPEVCIETPARRSGRSSPQSSPEGSLSSPGSTEPSSADEELPTPPSSTQKPKQSTQQRRAPHKPALSLNIPASSLALSQSALNTPNVQMVHTPTAPPAIEQPSSPTMRNRLGQIWAANSGDWNMASPALTGIFTGLEESACSQPAALHAMTAQAIAAGTPTLAVFPSGDAHMQAGASPFLHPSSNFAAYCGSGSPAMVENDYFSFPSS